MESDALGHLSDFILNHATLKKEERLGQGSSCEVYRMVDNDGNEYAVKLFPKTMSPAIRLQFISEIEATRKLIHPCVVQLIGFFLPAYDPKSPKKGSITMEFVNGKTLKAAIEEADPQLTPAKKLDISIAIAIGMRYVHSQNILHRDLKPGNICLTTHYRPKLVDFGLAKLNEGNEGNTTGMGTMRYMAPEVSESNSKYGLSVDVFSFGMILYELFTGNMPFHEEREVRASAKIIGGERPQLPSSLPKWISDLIQSCWSQNPSDRPSFDQICQILEPYDERGVFQHFQRKEMKARSKKKLREMLIEELDTHKRLKLEIRQLTEKVKEYEAKLVSQNHSAELKSELAKVKTELNAKITQLNNEKERMAQEIASLNNEKSKLLKENSDLKSKSADVSSIKSEKDRLAQEIVSLKNEKSKLLKENSDLKSKSADVSSIKSEKDRLGRENSDLKSRISSKEGEISSLRNERDKLKSEVDALKRTATSKPGPVTVFYQKPSGKTGHTYDLGESNKGYFMTMKGRTGRDVMSSGDVVIYASSGNTHIISTMIPDFDYNPEYKGIFTRPVLLETNDDKDSWLMFYFVKKTIRLTAYKVQWSRPQPKQMHPRAWVIEGSVDGFTFEVIQNNSSDLPTPSPSTMMSIVHREYVFELGSQTKPYQFLRLRQTEPDFTNDYVLRVSHFDVYGIVESQ